MASLCKLERFIWGGKKKKEKYGRMKRGELQDSSKKMSLKLVRI